MQVLNYYLRRVAASLSQRRRCCGARRLCVRVSVCRRVALVSAVKVMRCIHWSQVLCFDAVGLATGKASNIYLFIYLFIYIPYNEIT